MPPSGWYYGAGYGRFLGPQGTPWVEGGGSGYQPAPGVVIAQPQGTVSQGVTPFQTPPTWVVVGVVAVIALAIGYAIARKE